jgi:hypothetical protein
MVDEKENENRKLGGKKIKLGEKKKNYNNKQ